MSRSLRLIVLLVFGLVCLSSVPAQDLQDKSDTPFRRSLETVVRAYESGRWYDAYRLLQKIVEPATRPEMEQADQFVQDAGIAASAVDLLVQLRIDLVLSDRVPVTLRPGPTELPALLVGLSKRTAEVRAPIDRELIIAFRTDMPQEVMDQRMQELPGLLDQLEPLDRLLTQLDALTRKLKPAEFNGLDPQAQAVATRDFRKEKQDASRLGDQLVERVVELCLVRIGDMLEVLRSESTDYATRFRAARRIGSSLETLHVHWNRFKNAKTRTSSLGLPKDLEPRWRQYEAEYVQVAGGLHRKAYFFEEGKRWWLRARFGYGPLDRGLAKALPANVRRLDHALLYYPLRLPNPIPRPVDPLADPRSFPVARRHMEFWQVDPTVPFVDITGIATIINSGDPNLPKSYWAVAETNRLLASLDFLPDAIRYVGYLEYQAALKHFEELLRLATAAEQKALEETLAEDDRFIVHSNLSREYNDIARGSTLLLNPPRSEDPRAKGPYERRGLSWAMALARVELGAMRATALVHENPHLLLTDGRLEIGPFGRDLAGGAGQVGSALRNREIPAGSRRDLLPFVVSPPTLIEADAFGEILWDGARQQYYSLRSVREAQGLESIQRLDAFLVRVNVAIAMVSALREWHQNRWSSVQQQELSTWLAWLEELRRSIEVMLDSQIRFNSRIRFKATVNQNPADRLRGNAGGTNLGAAGRLLQPGLSNPNKATPKPSSPQQNNSPAPKPPSGTGTPKTDKVDRRPAKPLLPRQPNLSPRDEKKTTGAIPKDVK
jgi:hypothetical protein